MNLFSIELVKELGPTKVKAYYLCINGKNITHEMMDVINREGSYGHEIDNLLSIVRQACDLKTLSDKKFKQLNIKSKAGKVYEAKTKNLRMYLTHIEGSGRVIVHLGKKTNQKKDINQIKSLLSLLNDQGELPIKP